MTSFIRVIGAPVARVVMNTPGAVARAPAKAIHALIRAARDGAHRLNRAWTGAPAAELAAIKGMNIWEDPKQP